MHKYNNPMNNWYKQDKLMHKDNFLQKAKQILHNQMHKRHKIHKYKENSWYEMELSG